MHIALLGLALLVMASPARAQDYLGTHLDTIREETMRRHQQDMVTDRTGETESRTTRASASQRSRVSQADRQAVWSRNKAEYRRRMLRDGPAAADRWLDQQAQAAARTTPRTRTSRTSSRPKNCKKVRYVNRATPGFGGAAMTMSRVAVCAD